MSAITIPSSPAWHAQGTIVVGTVVSSTSCLPISPSIPTQMTTPSADEHLGQPLPAPSGPGSSTSSQWNLAQCSAQTHPTINLLWHSFCSPRPAPCIICEQLVACNSFSSSSNSSGFLHPCCCAVGTDPQLQCQLLQLPLQCQLLQLPLLLLLRSALFTSQYNTVLPLR